MASYNLPYPEAIFDIRFFKVWARDPLPCAPSARHCAPLPPLPSPPRAHLGYAPEAVPTTDTPRPPFSQVRIGHPQGWGTDNEAGQSRGGSDWGGAFPPIRAQSVARSPPTGVVVMWGKLFKATRPQRLAHLLFSTQKNPEPFFALAKELYPGQFKVNPPCPSPEAPGSQDAWVPCAGKGLGVRAEPGRLGCAPASAKRRTWAPDRWVQCGELCPILGNRPGPIGPNPHTAWRLPPASSAAPWGWGVSSLSPCPGLGSSPDSSGIVLMPELACARAVTLQCQPARTSPHPQQQGRPCQCYQLRLTHSPHPPMGLGRICASLLGSTGWAGGPHPSQPVPRASWGTRAGLKGVGAWLNCPFSPMGGGHGSDCPRSSPAHRVPLLHAPAEGEGAAAAVLHPGERKPLGWGA